MNKKSGLSCMSSLVNFFNNMSLKGTEANIPTITAQKIPSHTKAYSPKVAKKSIGKKRKSEVCVICIQHCTSSSSMKAEKCEHAVCDPCLRAYFDSILNERRYTITSFERIECPSPDCKATFLSERVIQNIYTAKQRDDWWATVAMKTNIQNKVCIYTKKKKKKEKKPRNIKLI